MTSDALEIDADGLPLLRRDPASPPADGLDVATALELEQQALLREDLELCDIWEEGKAVR